MQTKMSEKMKIVTKVSYVLFVVFLVFLSVTVPAPASPTSGTRTGSTKNEWISAYLASP